MTGKVRRALRRSCLGLKGLVPRLRNRELSGLAMKHVIDAVAELKTRFSGNIEAIETGTIRSYHERHESTRHISETLGTRGRLTSVDISPESIEISKDICHRSANIAWIQSDSISYLQNTQGQKFHFALLDSVNDKDMIFLEFRLLLPLMIEGGIVMVDDAGITPDGESIEHSALAQKGHSIWKFLKSCGATFDVIQAPQGHGTQIRIDLDKENLTKIEAALAAMDSSS